MRERNLHREGGADRKIKSGGNNPFERERRKLDWRFKKRFETDGVIFEGRAYLKLKNMHPAAKGKPKGVNWLTRKEEEIRNTALSWGGTS